MTWLLTDDVIAAFTSEGLPAPTAGNVRLVAYRCAWRKIKVGHENAYDLDDVTNTVLRRKAARRVDPVARPV